MKVFRGWAIRLMDKNGTKLYGRGINSLLMFTDLGPFTRIYRTRAVARRYLAADKRSYALKWKTQRTIGATATVVPINITVEEV